MLQRTDPNRRGNRASRPATGWLWLLVPGWSQVRQGRRDVGLFFFGWFLATMGIGALIYWAGSLTFLWGLWGTASALLWVAHFRDLKRYAEWLRKRQRRQLAELLFPGHPPRARCP